MRAITRIVLVAAAAFGGPAHAQQPSASLRLARLFGDGMVVQRDARIPVWGWAAPGKTVTVAFRGNTARATADRTGAWRAVFPATHAAGPFELVVESGTERLAIRDILVGDVWVASGQSNMEFEVAFANDARQEIASAHDAKIRHFKVPQSWSDTPARDLVGGSWASADPEHVGDFSAVAYFFARELRKSVDVPIGIVNTTWGGSAIESWLSARAQELSDSAWRDLVQEREAYASAIRDSLRARIGALPAADGGLIEGRALWADPSLDDASWSAMPVPSHWERNGYAGLDGVAWYRTTITLSESEARQGARLSLGTIDDDDITWVNGVEVGRTVGYNKPRAYVVAPAALRAGPNVIAVRVVDGGGDGGIYGDTSRVYLEVGSERRSLAGNWKFKVGEVALRPDGQRINKIPTVLYNQMVHPLLPFPIKGVIWYQGESNANTYEQGIAYRRQFAELVDSWRRDWAAANGPASVFPFLWVQLPNYGPADAEPAARSAWATQRESMNAALALPRTGQAVAIDLGEAGDIHPRNKQDVGRRLALVARGVAYGQSVRASGPTYRAHVVRNGRVEVSFDNVGGGLVARDGSGVGGFAIAGADRRLVWAQASIEGKRVIVWSDRVPSPVAVRYGWDNNPDRANLFNRDGLPAAPFRTDRW